MSEPTGQVTIIGAGLAGCLLAALLGRRGMTVTVYERRPDPRAAGAEQGRSINLALSARGLHALDRIGLQEDALAMSLPMHGRMLHEVGGGLAFRPYSADGTQAINSIGRAALNAALLDAAERTPGVSLLFEHTLTALDLYTGALAFDTPTERVEVPADVVLACDGSSSTTRRMVADARDVSEHVDYLTHGYKELTIPPRDGDYALDPDALHIWPRGESMMIALPNTDRSFTATLFWPESDLAALRTPEQIIDCFRRDYPDALPLLTSLVEDYTHNPSSTLATVRCWPWVHRGRQATLALIGDAAHAIVPFFGQGANAALEDCAQLERCLDEADDDWPTALSRYQRDRKPDGDAIAEMALENFVEMRDTVTSRVFQARVATRHALERRMPDRFISRYELVSFTSTPYSQIPARMRQQDRLLLVVAGTGLAAVATLAAVAGRLLRRRTPG